MLAPLIRCRLRGPSAAAPAAFPAWARAGRSRRKARPKRPFWPARRLPASTRSSGKTRPGPAFPPAPGAQRRGASVAAPADGGRGGLARRVPSHPAGRPIPDPQDGGSSPGGSSCARSIGQWRSSFHAAAEVLGVPHDEALQEAVDAAEACAADKRPAPFAAAQVFALARRALTRAPGASRLGGRGGEGELLAAGSPIACWPSASNGRSRCPCSPRLCSPAPGGARRGERDGAEGRDRVRLRQGGGARLRPLGRARAAGAKAAGGPAEIARQGGCRRRWGRCSTRIPSARPPKSAGKYRSAARGGCSTGWLRSARCAN